MIFWVIGIGWLCSFVFAWSLCRCAARGDAITDGEEYEG